MADIKCDIDGVIIRELKKNIDSRGWLAEFFREDELPEGYRPAMGYISSTMPGVARGPHEHKKQTDYFCFVGPSIFRIYLWDNRPESPTYRNKCRFEVSEKRMVAFLIPPGVVHAYKNIGSTDALVFNAPDKLYAGKRKKKHPDEIRYEDMENTEFIVD